MIPESSMVPHGMSLEIHREKESPGGGGGSDGVQNRQPSVGEYG